MCEVSFDDLSVGPRVAEPPLRGVDRRELSAVGGVGAELGIERRIDLAATTGDEPLRARERRGRRPGREDRRVCSPRGLERRARGRDELDRTFELASGTASISDGARELAAPDALVARTRLPDGS